MAAMPASWAAVEALGRVLGPAAPMTTPAQ
jgi:hypothetical protein